jgi:hypothetical protein
MSVNQVIGGAFQDSVGNLLANGSLVFKLNQDATVTASPTTQLCADYEITVPLNEYGGIVTSPTYSFWPNDQLTPSTTFYTVTAYSASGQLCWGPAYVKVLTTPSPFDVGVWVP